MLSFVEETSPLYNTLKLASVVSTNGTPSNIPTTPSHTFISRQEIMRKDGLNITISKVLMSSLTSIGISLSRVPSFVLGPGNQIVVQLSCANNFLLRCNPTQTVVHLDHETQNKLVLSVISSLLHYLCFKYKTFSLN